MKVPRQVQWGLLAALLVSSVAPAAADPVSPRLSNEGAANEAVATVAAPPPKPARPSYVGLTFDLGLPDIIGLGLVVRPVWWLRLQAGGSTDLFSGGLGGGVVFVPLRRRFSPGISLEGGHVFAAQTLGVPNAFGINADGQRVGYDYAALMAGLEVAINRRVSLSGRAGVTFVELSAVPDGTKPQPPMAKVIGASIQEWLVAGKIAVTVFL
jgi:hypothetical protein